MKRLTRQDKQEIADFLMGIINSSIKLQRPLNKALAKRLHSKIVPFDGKLYRRNWCKQQKKRMKDLQASMHARILARETAQ